MKSYNEAQERANQLRERLYGHYSKTYKAKVIDIFPSPNNWVNAHQVYGQRLYNLGYPQLSSDDHTIMVALENHNIEVAGDLIVNDGLLELQPLIVDLPPVRGNKQDVLENTSSPV